MSAEINAAIQLDLAKFARKRVIAEAKESTFAANFSPNGIAGITGVTWKLRGAEVTRLASDLGYQQSRLAAAADADAKNAILASSIEIPTTEGPQTLTVAQVITLYLAFGAWARAIETTGETRLWSIDSASTIEAANAIVWS